MLYFSITKIRCGKLFSRAWIGCRNDNKFFVLNEIAAAPGQGFPGKSRFVASRIDKPLHET
jgi:hypothetical protein